MLKKLLPFIFLAASLHAQTVAYVTNRDNTVSVINTTTNTVAATIQVGADPTGVVFSPDGARAYVTNLVDGTISVVDSATNTVIATVALPDGPRPGFPAITPD